jgi:hypothetical protein
VPNRIVTDLAARAGRLLGEWAVNPAAGGPLAGKVVVLVQAAAGSGKSRTLNRAARRAVRAGLRVLVTANTNEQIHALVRDLHALGLSVVHYCATAEMLANPPPGVISSDDPAVLRGATLVVGTTYKIGRAARDASADLGHFDVGFVDEAYQVSSTTAALWALTTSDRWAFIGDPGQIASFTSLGRSPYVGDDDPVTSIVDSCISHGVDMGELRYDWTWRLPHHGAPMLTPFYGRAIPAAADAADRSLVLGPARARRGLARAAERVVERAAACGWGYLELDGDPLDRADPDTAAGIAAIVDALLARGGTATCERHGTRQLTPADLGVMVATSTQKGVTEAALAATGRAGVPVRTFNTAQGLEFSVSVLWHPLSGVEELDGFAADLGRLCVGISRHRHACVLVGQRGLRHHLTDPPISAEAPWPGQRDRFLAGWLAHAGVLDELDRIGASVAA